MLALLGGAAIRSFVLAAGVWLTLRVPAVRHTRLHLTAWTIVLVAALLMPVATEVASGLLPPAPLAPPAMSLLVPSGIGPRPRHDAAAVPARNLPGPFSAARTGDAGTTHMIGRPAGAARWPEWHRLALLTYAIVCCGLLARLALGVLLAARVARAATPLGESWARGHDVRLSNAICAPATFGSIILLPPDCPGWPLITRMAVLAHEAAHVERRDFHIQLAATLHRAIFWFSPLSWWLRRKLADLAEVVCDDAAILDLQDRAAYAAILLEMSDRTTELPACVAMARPATVPARVRRILAGTQIQTPAYAWRRATLIGCTLGMVAMATFPLTADLATAEPDNAPQQTPRQPIAIDSKLLDADVGYYQDMQTGSLMIVTRDGDHLLTGRLGGSRYVEYPYTNYDFFLTDLPQTNHFVTSASGAAVQVIHYQGGSEGEVLDRVSTETALRLKSQHDRHVAEELLPRTKIKLDEAVLANYVGYYQISPMKIIAITREGVQLFAQTINEGRFPVFPYTDQDFFYTSTAAQITFVKPADAVATALILHKDGKDRVAPRIGPEAAEQMQRRWDDERKPHVRIVVDDALLDRYVGRYVTSDMTVIITRGGSHLIAEVAGYPEYSIYPYTDRDFFATEYPTQYSFVASRDGRVIQLVKHSFGVDKTLRRVDQADCPSNAVTPCLLDRSASRR